MRDPETTHRIMSSIRSKDTKPEIILRKALWKNGLRYRVNYKKLPGKPDIVFTKEKLVVFCDGDFWHGHNWALRGISSFEEELQRYSPYWREKLLKNVARDKEINRELEVEGWRILRLWESEIKKDLSSCVEAVKEALFEAQIEQMCLSSEEPFVLDEAAENEV